MYRYNESEALKEATRKIERERLRSPRIQRNYIPPPIIVSEEPVSVEAPIPKSRIRKQMLSMMNIWNQRRRSQRVKRVQQRLQQQQQGNGSRTLDAKWQQLRLSMKYGELSDDFYSYCRRWRKDTDFLARGRVAFTKPIPPKPVANPTSLPLRLMFNFRFFTRLMLATYQTRLQRVAWDVCFKQMQTKRAEKNYPKLGMSADGAGMGTDTGIGDISPPIGSIEKLLCCMNAEGSPYPRTPPSLLLSDSCTETATSFQNDTCILKNRSTLQSPPPLSTLELPIRFIACTGTE